LSGAIRPRRIVSMLRSRTGRVELGKLLGRDVPPADRLLFDRQLRFSEKRDCGALCISDPGYPERLKEINDPPPLLFYKGDTRWLDSPAIGVVGSRRSSRRGLITARTLASELSRRGFLIVSGLARGIDSMAHEGALDGRGGTCAVLGCGIDVAYPPENVSLALEISRRGCLLSEFPPETPPFKYHFPVRNRVISGLSLGILVVEAGIKSGAMGTAGWAGEQGREVFAVPGPVESEGSRGPHRLIREGACLVESVEDILAGLPSPWKEGDAAGGSIIEIPFAEGSGAPGYSLDEMERKVLASLTLDPKHIDEILQICHISATSILPLLLNLEMKGLVESCGGGTFARLPLSGKGSCGGI
ncbi:MAG: DNA-processing protein DprA, partial [Candidatus Krumholzibacteriota bacterium]|nr:DNA-processing protein DprA [Candidatus Krumholzibacteriota bacterium]